jgi:hypothetical protein
MLVRADDHVDALVIQQRRRPAERASSPFGPEL